MQGMGGRTRWLGLLLLALLGAGCARREQETVVRFWAMGREAEVVAELVRDFERENPGVRVQVQASVPDTA